ncbi:Auxin responsive SAUR protein [Artemisia annua]|uniref:Auxin responsive SAUR protein n=1 Tax=Artemisia annua TaxID=35608 RepID=A0A2U1LAK7_ARTAN|nr:Auxin responsive SAUR protein [Artemisia annua]
MGLQNLPRILNAKLGKQRILSPSSATETPKGYFSIYVGESRKKRFLVPLAYLRHPSFQALLNLSQDEFGYAHPMGGLTFPCKVKRRPSLKSPKTLSNVNKERLSSNSPCRFIDLYELSFCG